MRNTIPQTKAPTTTINTTLAHTHNNITTQFHHFPLKQQRTFRASRPVRLDTGVIGGRAIACAAEVLLLLSSAALGHLPKRTRQSAVARNGKRVTSKPNARDAPVQARAQHIRGLARERAAISDAAVVNCLGCVDTDDVTAAVQRKNLFA